MTISMACDALDENPFFPPSIQSENGKNGDRGEVLAYDQYLIEEQCFNSNSLLL